MPHCYSCGTLLGDDVRICPICDSIQDRFSSSNLDNVDNKLVNTPNILSSYNSTDAGNTSNYSKGVEFEGDMAEEIARLMKRGEECFKSGKAWLGAKDRSRARKEFQRAFNYYETILKLDPDNEPAREARARCLFKMA